MFFFFRVEIPEAGDMKVCLDNTFSHFASKIVFFELISDDEDQVGDGDEAADWDGAKDEIHELMDMTIEELKVFYLLFFNITQRTRCLVVVSLLTDGL
jgi:hypothetical protein